MESCEQIVTYKKADASEVIEVGDIVMIDPDNALITRAVLDDSFEGAFNARLVVGVCINSNNTAKLRQVLDGGMSRVISRKELNGGNASSIQTIIIAGGDSSQNAREIIQVAYAGEYPVNVCGYVDLGDRLCVSSHAGKAKAIDYADNDYFRARSIGKVIKFMNSRDKVKVLLDIE